MIADSASAGRVHIILRTKNRTMLLARALDDILAQSIDDWDVTVVNDGGAADEVDRLVGEREEGFAGRVAVIHNSVSRGMEAAANQGILSREAAFIAIHDDDDTWHPDFLARTREWLSANDEALAIAVRTEIVWERIDGDAVTELDREIFLPALRDVTLFDLVRFNTCVPISMLYRSSALHAVGLFDESLPVTGDWEFNVRLAFRGAIGFLPDTPLAYWHQRPGQGGVMGNSVIALRHEHASADRLVRDRALRKGDDSDLGLALYLTRYLDERFDEIHRRLGGVERLVGDTFFRRAVGAARRILRRGPRG